MSLWGDLLPQMDVFLADLFQGPLNLQGPDPGSNQSLCFHWNWSLNFFVLNKKTKSLQRIGPHNIDVLSVFFGSLLGDAFAECRAGSTRVCFQQENSNASYLSWLHGFFATRGYCNPNKPKYQRRIGKQGKIRFVLRFKTYSFRSLTWMHTLFYENQVKKIPESVFLDLFLTPQALAVWIMDDGTRSGSGLSIATYSFVYADLLRMQAFLTQKYGLKVSVNKSGVKHQFILYFHKKTMGILVNRVEPFMVENMKYKLGKYGSSIRPVWNQVDRFYRLIHRTTKGRRFTIVLSIKKQAATYIRKV